jgi:HD-GYP domain-containing protein (c-di-GMP phosphodiesterase class II)
MRQLNAATRAYLTAVVVCTAALAAVTLRTTPHHGSIVVGLVFTAVAALADGIDFEISRKYRVSLVPVVHVAMILTLPPGLAVVVAVAAVTIEQAAHHRPRWYQSVFNVAHHALVVMAPALLVYHSWPEQLERSPAGAASVAEVSAVILLYYALDTMLLAGVIALAEREPLRRVLARNHLPTVLFDLTLGSAGALLGIVWTVFPPFGLLIVLPVVVTHLAYRNLKRIERETLTAVEKMADIVDARDPYTAGHCARVAVYAGWIAEALGLAAEEAGAILSAARVHDLGKIGIPDAVLLKPSALTDEEFAVMKRHSGLGADLLASYSVYAHGADMVRHHHERVDGDGYPTGLVGEGVPLGARIIAVADAFDAMTTDRPYRRALTEEAALAELDRGAGQQWDAEFVRIFVQQARVRGKVPQSSVGMPSAMAGVA